MSACKHCGSATHYSIACFRAKKRVPNSRSFKQVDYELWLEQIARPKVIKRDGNFCKCCGRPAKEGEKLDLDHIKGKGAHAELKQKINNLQLLCRFPCHFRKTNNIKCH